MLLLACDRAPSGGGVASAASSASARPRSCAAECKLAGLCAWNAERERCLARGEEDCRAADSCKTSGLCGFDKGYCVSASVDDCRGSELCQREGMCSLGAAACEARGEDCRASDECKRRGHCTAIGGKCVVETADDCAGAEVCRQSGLCSMKPTWRGDFTVKVCAALSNADCERSAVCKDNRQCTAANDGCR